MICVTPSARKRSSAVLLSADCRAPSSTPGTRWLWKSIRTFGTLTGGTLTGGTLAPVVGDPIPLHRFPQSCVERRPRPEPELRLGAACVEGAARLAGRLRHVPRDPPGGTHRTP